MKVVLDPELQMNDVQRKKYYDTVMDLHDMQRRGKEMTAALGPMYSQMNGVAEKVKTANSVPAGQDESIRSRRSSTPCGPIRRAGARGEWWRWRRRRGGGGRVRRTWWWWRGRRRRRWRGAGAAGGRAAQPQLARKRPPETPAQGGGAGAFGGGNAPPNNDDLVARPATSSGWRSRRCRATLHEAYNDVKLAVPKAISDANAVLIKAMTMSQSLKKYDVALTVYEQRSEMVPGFRGSEAQHTLTSHLGTPEPGNSGTIMRGLSIPTTTHGRVVVEDAAVAPISLLVAFHGYAQSADETLADVRTIPGASAWTIASVQGLHRFYNRNSEKVIASWMTRQDARRRDCGQRRVHRWRDRCRGRAGTDCVRRILAGRVDGVSRGRARVASGGWCHRAGRRHSAGSQEQRLPRPWPAVLIGGGERDTWFTPAKAEADAAFLAAQQVPHDVVRFAGGHEWTDEFRAAAARWLQRVIQAAATSRA